MFLVFSPVTHCSVEVYAISVGCEKKRHWQTLGARWSEPKWHVVWMCVKLWLIESVCSCITVSQRPEAVCHIHQGPVLIFYKICSLYWAKKKKEQTQKTLNVLSVTLPTVYDWQRVGRQWQVLHYVQPLNYELTSAAGCALLESK